MKDVFKCSVCGIEPKVLFLSKDGKKWLCPDHFWINSKNLDNLWNKKNDSNNLRNLPKRARETKDPYS